MEIHIASVVLGGVTVALILSPGVRDGIKRFFLRIVVSLIGYIWVLFRHAKRKYQKRETDQAETTQKNPPQETLSHTDHDYQDHTSTEMNSQEHEQHQAKEFVSKRPIDTTHEFWLPDHSVDSCLDCREDFSLFKRRHHCRFCGKIFCGACTSNLIQTHRACVKCHKIMTETMPNGASSEGKGQNKIHSSGSKKEGKDKDPEPPIMSVKQDASSQSLVSRFQEAASKVENMKQDKELSNKQKLQMYAYYKQGVKGDVLGDRPGSTDVISRLKWDAWNGIKGTSKEDAMTAYIKLVRYCGAIQ